MPGSAAEQDHVAGGRVIGHRRLKLDRRAGRRGLLRPGRAVPGPGVVLHHAIPVNAAEQDDVAGGRVIGHRLVGPAPRAGRREVPGPGRAIPGPGAGAG